jgi:hypothetical protein
MTETLRRVASGPTSQSFGLRLRAHGSSIHVAGALVEDDDGSQKKTKAETKSKAEKLADMWAPHYILFLGASCTVLFDGWDR